MEWAIEVMCRGMSSRRPFLNPSSRGPISFTLLRKEGRSLFIRFIQLEVSNQSVLIFFIIVKEEPFRISLMSWPTNQD
jgi:hypothetical protein